MDFVVTVCVSKVATDSYVVHHVFLKERSFVMIRIIIRNIIMIRIIIRNMIIMIQPGTSPNSQVPSSSPHRDPSAIALWPMSLDQSPWTCLFVPSNVRTVVPMSKTRPVWQTKAVASFIKCISQLCKLYVFIKI